MKCQILLWGKNKKTITNLMSAESARSAVSVNDGYAILFFCFP